MKDTEWERSAEEWSEWRQHLKEVDALLSGAEASVAVEDLREPHDTEGLGTHYIVYNNPSPPPTVEWEAYMGIGCGWGRLAPGQPLVHCAGPGCPGEEICYRSIWG